tara:strand:- start:266 stop:820 length:555 start_codon:yes stop_codon:yes gene_type:complete
METTLYMKNIKDRVDSVYSGKAYTSWMDKTQAREVRASQAFRKAFYANIEANVRKDMHKAVKDRSHDLTMETMKEMHKAKRIATEATQAFKRAVKAYDKMFEDKGWGGYVPAGLANLDRAVDYKLLERIRSNFYHAVENIEDAGSSYGWEAYYAPLATCCSDWNDFHTHIREAKIVVRNGGEAI